MGVGGAEGMAARDKKKRKRVTDLKKKENCIKHEVKYLKIASF